MTKRQSELFPELPSDKKYVSDYPLLVAEWHPTKNKNKFPDDYLYQSNKKVWWKCERGHEWETSIDNRAKKRGCPYCSNRLVCNDNNLAVINPSLAKYWSPKNKVPPTMVLPRSGKKFLWACEHGHEWEDRPHNLFKKKFPCPKCEYADRGDGLREATDNHNLATENPILMHEWNYAKNDKPPTYYMPKSNDKVWWKCEHGHEWQANIDSRTRGNGCPYCGKTLASPEYNLKVLYPDLMHEWHPTKNGDKKPEKFRPQSNHKVWWQCAKGHEWEAVIGNRTTLGNGCPSCSNQSSKNEIRIYTELMSIFDDIFHRHKIEGVEADIFIPEINLAIEYDGKYWHRDKTEQDKLKTSFFFDRQIKLIRIREHPLPKLEDDDIIIPMGSFLTKKTMNEVIKLSNAEGNKVTEYLEKSEFVAEETYLTYIDYFPSPFPENSLAEVNPELAKEWHPTKNKPLTPYNFTRSARLKVWWQCDEGHEWKANIYSRNLGGHGCPVCTGKVASSENCMAVTHPELTKLFHPTKNGDHSPETLKAGTGIKLWWICDKGHEWQRDGDHMKRLKSEEKCPHCRKEKPSK